MIIKVCGMREEQNLAAVVDMGVDLVGFINYPPSPRYAPEPPATQGVGRVGVFVNENEKRILATAQSLNLSHLQLHGSESRELCMALRARGYKVIKAISVAAAEDLAICSEYEGAVDMLLFDTKTPRHGGSGVRFDWSIIDSYKGSTPFLLSGGIDETMAREILSIDHPMMAGIDLNSRFEISPARKDIEKLRKFINEIR